MDAFQKRLIGFIADKGLFLPESRLLVAVSGGVDSVVLLHALHTLGYRLGVAHVNYQLRGENSEADQRLVEEYARSQGAEFFGKRARIDTDKRAGESLQMTARRIRYTHFEKILEEYNYDAIVTAHHLDDQLETMLINFLRGTGIRGMAGMQPVAAYVRRPLLSHSRAEILAYAKRHGLAWREDASNATDNYLRNRVRHHLSPLLREMGLTDKALRNTTEHLGAARRIFTRDVATRRQNFVHQQGDTLHFELDRLREQTDDAATYLFEWLHDDYGFTEEQIRQLLTAQRTITLTSPTHTGVLREGVFTLGPNLTSTTPLPALKVTTLPFVFETHQERFRLSITARPAELDVAGVQYFSVPGLSPGASTPPTLHLRPRQNGEKLQLLGMNGRHKKLQDVLTDRKIPRAERDGLYLILDQNEEILAIPGLLVTHPGRVREADEWVIQIEQVPG